MKHNIFDFIFDCYVVCRIGRKEGGVNLLYAIGFSRVDDNTLTLPLDFEASILEARKLEIEVALQKLRRKIELVAAKSKDKPKKIVTAMLKTKSTTSLGNQVKRKDQIADTTTLSPLKRPSEASSRPTTPGQSTQVVASGSSHNDTKVSVVTPPQQQLTRKQLLAVEEERKRRVKAEKLVQAQKATLLTLQNRVEDLQAAHEHRKGVQYESTIGPLFERYEQTSSGPSPNESPAGYKETKPKNEVNWFVLNLREVD